MKSSIPDALKADIPQTKWGKILTTTPVVMTVVATLLAGLASSEMTRAQYDRSLAAQQQSKAGDQWSYFQAKRLRGAMQRCTLDILQNTTPLRPFDAVQFRKAVAAIAGTPDQGGAAAARTALLTILDSSAGQQTLELLAKGELPELPALKAADPQVERALEAIENSRPEAEMHTLIAPIKEAALDETLRAAIGRVQSYDGMLRGHNRTIDEVERLFPHAVPPPQAGKPAMDNSPARDFAAARLHFQALRYDAESRLNQAIANVYELQVRKSNLTAERHHTRSQRFFFGMLAAQAAVIIATFSIAAQKRNLLWSLAAAAGLAAVAFAVYVYFYN